MQTADQTLTDLERQHRDLVARIARLDQGDTEDGDDLHDLMRRVHAVRDRAFEQTPATMAGAAALARIAQDASEDPNSFEVRALNHFLFLAR